MTELAARRPMYLEVGETKITEHGKRWFDAWVTGIERFRATIIDVAKLALSELWDWQRIQRALDAEGVPQALSSGISKTQMQALINASTKQAVYTAPGAFVVALATAAPSSSSTGAAMSETAYVGYARTAATMGASTNADPSVATNSGTVTFPNCTGTGSTLLGFCCCDSATTGAGAALWYGTLTSTVISTTQTPPTIAAGALSLSMTGV